MPDSEKRTLYGEAIVAPYDIEHLLHIYTPHKREDFIISKEDFVDNSLSVYSSKIPLFKEFRIKEGDVIGALFKESEDGLSQRGQECKIISDKSEDVEKYAHSFTKTFTLQNGNVVKNPQSDNDKTSDYSIVEGTYKYESLYYESPYIEIITASYDDEKGRLDIALKTQDAFLVSKIIAESLNIDEKNVRVSTIPYSSSFDEYFLSTIKAAVIAAKASEKFGANIRYMYRPYSASPSFEIRRRTVVDKTLKSVISENVEITSDFGNALVFEEECSSILYFGTLALYDVKEFSLKVNLLSSSNDCTALFSSYIKAVSLSSSVEHLYRIAFEFEKEPILFLEECLTSNIENTKTNETSFYKELLSSYQSLLKSEDAYTESAVFALNNRKKGIMLSSISALNKATSISSVLLSGGFPLNFGEKNTFAFGAIKDAENSNIKLYIGTSTSIENKARLDDAVELLKNNTKNQDVALTLKGVPRDESFTSGPDIMFRHTSIVLGAIKNAIENKKIRKDFSLFPLYKGNEEVLFQSNFWGNCVLKGYKDFVTDELVITSIHLNILHSNSFNRDDDSAFYKQLVLKILYLLSVRLSVDFENDEDFKIDFIISDAVFDGAEGIFPLVFSSVRVLLFLLSPERKLKSDIDLNGQDEKNSDDKENIEVEGGTNEA